MLSPHERILFRLVNTLWILKYSARIRGDGVATPNEACASTWNGAGVAGVPGDLPSSAWDILVLKVTKGLKIESV